MAPDWTELLPPSALRQLSDEEIAAGRHRELVGGSWEEHGRAQLEFSIARGLLPKHRLLDIGCGALRGGLCFIRYLEPGRYYGVDANPSLIRAAEVELARSELDVREPHLAVDGEFCLDAFGVKFPFVWAQSVFTHLPLNSIQRCLHAVSRVLEPGGRFFASYRAAPKLHFFEPIEIYPGSFTYADRNPYHYHSSVFEFLCRELDLEVRDLGAWRPGGARMLEIRKI